MYHHLTGALVQKSPAEAVVETAGVGYQLRIPLSTYEALPAPGQRVTLLTHLHVTDSAHTLFGFGTAAERDFFLQLNQNVNGVGPKLALAVLSRGPIPHLQQAIRLGNWAALKGGGVGEATAKRIVLELGKILARQAEPEAQSPARAGRKGVPPAPAEASAAAGPVEDQLTATAVKAVMQLNEVQSDVALRAVQRAQDELRDARAAAPTVQDLIRRALAYTE